MKYLKLVYCLAAIASMLVPGVASAQVSAMPGAPPARSAAPPAASVAQPLPAAPGAAPPPASRWTAAQVREAFDLADSNSNGELSRAEAQQLRILPRSFEDMDKNKDGVLDRSEYEGAFIR